MSKKNIVIYICQNCDYQYAKWQGRCSECGSWNSIEEQSGHKKRARAAESETESRPQKLSEIKHQEMQKVKTGISECDRVLGGGLAEGSLLLIGGEPGVGKSTLLLSVIKELASQEVDNKILYISGEESVAQIAQRCNRLDVKSENIFFLHETTWQKMVVQIQKFKPKFIVIDSIQTTLSTEVQSVPGSLSQIREVTFEIMNLVKTQSITCFIVGHITKDGTIAGPKILEHMVDTVLTFEGDQFGHYRILRANKNRFGNTSEIGIFEMVEKGLRSVDNPSSYFLESSIEKIFGRSLSMVMEGSRAMFVEIQALVVENKYGNGKRTTQGIDVNRLAMMVAIAERYLGLPLGFHDIYINVIGGLKIQAREIDLSLMASLLSSYYGKVVAKKTIFIGEVGLTGEVRCVPNIESRLKEIDVMNYQTLVASSRVAREFAGKYKFEIVGIEHVKELEKIIS